MNWFQTEEQKNIFGLYSFLFSHIYMFFCSSVLKIKLSVSVFFASQMQFPYKLHVMFRHDVYQLLKACLLRIPAQ